MRLMILAGLTGSLTWFTPSLLMILFPIYFYYSREIGLVRWLPNHSYPTSMNLLLLHVGPIVSFMLAWMIIALILFFIQSRTIYHGMKGGIDGFIALLGGAVSGLLAGFMGYQVGYSHTINRIMSIFDISDRLPEPFMSLGFIAGSGLFALIISSRINKNHNGKLHVLSPILVMLWFSISALIGRVVVLILFSIIQHINFYSMDVYYFLRAMVVILGGFIFGCLVVLFNRRQISINPE